MRIDILENSMKRPYIAPSLIIQGITPILMLAISGVPEVHTTGSKANTNYEALGREDNGYSIWDDDWDE